MIETLLAIYLVGKNGQSQYSRDRTRMLSGLSHMSTGLDSPEIVLFTIFARSWLSSRRRRLGIVCVGIILQLLFAAGADDNHILSSGASEPIPRSWRRFVSRFWSGLAMVVEAVGLVVKVDRIIGKRIVHIAENGG
jgi:hypothetical protein